MALIGSKNIFFNSKTLLFCSYKKKVFIMTSIQNAIKKHLLPKEV